MIEPTQDDIVTLPAEAVIAAFDWLAGRIFNVDTSTGLEFTIDAIAAVPAAHFAHHRTAELQAKIDRLEIGMVTLEHTAAVLKAENTKLVANKPKAFDPIRYEERITTLEAELAARDFAPISDAHRDGRHWLVGWMAGYEWITETGFWEFDNWYASGYGSRMTPTHAAPLPQPPKEVE